jgi:putative membrane protein
MSAPLGSSSYAPSYGGTPSDGWGRRRTGPPTWVLVAVVAIAIVAVLTIVSWWYLASSAPSSTGRPDAYWGYFPFGLLFVLFVAFFLVRVAFWTSYRGRGSGGRQYRYGHRARAILAERYARGEISREQYQQMLRDLQPPP